MKVAITGATGFIGKLLVEKHISVGDEVHILTRRNDVSFSGAVKVHRGDLSDGLALTAFVDNADVLYHCAAEIRNESKMQHVNVDGTKNLISAAKGRIKHWVQLSSVGVYGPVFSGAVTEESPYNPINEYEKTKLESDLLVLDAAKENAFTYTFIRPSNVFGTEMRNASLFALFNTVEKGLYFFTGPKGASANYVPVENVIEALYLAATNKNAVNRTYNISDWTTIEEFIGSIADVLNKKVNKTRIPAGLMLTVARLTSFIPKNPLTVSRVNALTGRASYPNTKIERELGYRPVIGVLPAIRNLVNYYKKQKDVPEAN